MSRGYAFFDLDHTLLPHDTQALFCNFVLRKEGWRRGYLFLYLGSLVPFALRLFSLRFMKRIFASYLWGMPGERLRAHVEEFLATDFRDSLYPEVIAELERQREAGRILVLNSASPEFYLEGIAKQLGFDHFLGTDMIVEERMPLLPEIVGPNNKREAKITAMVERGIIPDIEEEGMEMFLDSWSYSDSAADIPLLSIAEHAVMIHPGERLAAVGLEKGWRTMTPPRPYSGRRGDCWASFLQILGIYRVTGGSA